MHEINVYALSPSIQSPQTIFNPHIYNNQETHTTIVAVALTIIYK